MYSIINIERTFIKFLSTAPRRLFIAYNKTISIYQKHTLMRRISINQVTCAH